jgi:hypothetical protein
MNSVILSDLAAVASSIFQTGCWKGSVALNCLQLLGLPAAAQIYALWGRE